MLKVVLGFFAVVIVVLSILLQRISRSKIPEHLLHWKVFAKDDLIPRSTVTQLVELMKEMKEFPNNIDQNKVTGMMPVYEDIGEGELIQADGTCKHPLLFPNSAKTKCILPQRVDIGKHFILSGGLDGIKENHKDLLSRVSSFGRYTFIQDLDKYPILKNLFNSNEFQSAAKSVCPNYDNNTVLDAFQFNFVMQAPGQTVAAHLDGPYFWGATRFHYPQWLLVCMVFSGLFVDKFINQIQVVGYLHDWQLDDRLGGEFVYYLNNQDDGWGVVSPKTGSGTIVDGSKVVHAAKIYRSDVKAPFLDKDKECILTFIQDDDWAILCDGETIAKYKTSDLRMSVVYRARCFTSQDELKKYHSQTRDDMIPLETILNTFTNDLIKNKGFTEKQLIEMNRLDFAMLLIDQYLKYPLPPKQNALIPINYCALPLILPWTSSFFKMICV